MFSTVCIFVWSGSNLLFYLVVWLSPSAWFYRRPAIFTYAQFWCVFRVLYTASLALQYHGSQVGQQLVEEAGACMEVGVGYIVFIILHPLIVYWTFIQYSRYVIS